MRFAERLAREAEGRARAMHRRAQNAESRLGKAKNAHEKEIARLKLELDAEKAKQDDVLIVQSKLWEEAVKGYAAQAKRAEKDALAWWRTASAMRSELFHLLADSTGDADKAQKVVDDLYEAAFKKAKKCS